MHARLGRDLQRSERAQRATGPPRCITHAVKIPQLQAGRTDGGGISIFRFRFRRRLGQSRCNTNRALGGSDGPRHTQPPQRAGALRIPSPALRPPAHVCMYVLCSRVLYMQLASGRSSNRRLSREAGVSVRDLAHPGRGGATCLCRPCPWALEHIATMQAHHRPGSRGVLACDAMCDVCTYVSGYGTEGAESHTAGGCLHTRYACRYVCRYVVRRGR